MRNASDSDVVWQTIANMRQLDFSLQSFYQILESDLVNQKGPLSCTKPIKTYSSRTEEGWCCYTDFRVYELRRRNPDTRRHKYLGRLTVGVELWRDVDGSEPGGWTHAKAPMIYVGFCPEKDHWPEGMALDCRGRPVGVPEWEGGKVVPPTETAPCLWEWVYDNDIADGTWDERIWYFALRLFDIDSREAIQTEIMEPLRSLLGDGESSIEAFRNKKAIREGG